jgi:hypothetical protein
VDIDVDGEIVVEVLRESAVVISIKLEETIVEEAPGTVRFTEAGKLSATVAYPVRS